MAVAKRFKIKDPAHPELGDITGSYTIDWETGVTVYRVTARRVTGAFEIVPDVKGKEHCGAPGHRRYLTDLDPDQQHATVYYGLGDRWVPAQRRERPVVNGVTISGGSGVDLDWLREGRLDRWNVVCSRGGGYMNAPDATHDRVAIVVDCLLRHWMTRPEHYALRLAACRAAADTARTSAEEDVEWATGLLREARRQLARARAAVESAAALAAAPVAGPPDPDETPNVAHTRV